MSINQQNIQMLIKAAHGFGDLLDKVAFLGGATTGLLITDPLALDVRPTLDVDVITEVGSRFDYMTLEEELRNLGFKNDMSDSSVICRWKLDDLTIDIMPTTADILGFSNRWYNDALHNAQPYPLTDDLEIKLITAPYFIATKIEAFHGRGNNDFYGSHDLEDLIAVIDGRSELVEEVLKSDPTLKQFISGKTRLFLGDRDFMQALPGHITIEERIPIIEKRLRLLADLN